MTLKAPLARLRRLVARHRSRQIDWETVQWGLDMAMSPLESRRRVGAAHLSELLRHPGLDDMDRRLIAVVLAGQDD